MKQDRLSSPGLGESCSQALCPLLEEAEFDPNGMSILEEGDRVPGMLSSHGAGRRTSKAFFPIRYEGEGAHRQFVLS